MAYEHLEELDSALSHLTDSSKPRLKTDMAKVALDIEKFKKQHPQWQPPKHPPTLELYKYGIEECDVDKMLSIGDKIKYCRTELSKHMEHALQAKEGTPDYATSWDIVEELEA